MKSKKATKIAALTAVILLALVASFWLGEFKGAREGALSATESSMDARSVNIKADVQFRKRAIAALANTVQSDNIETLIPQDPYANIPQEAMEALKEKDRITYCRIRWKRELYRRLAEALNKQNEEEREKLIRLLKHLNEPWEGLWENPAGGLGNSLSGREAQAEESEADGEPE
jgi:hypothetical protein